MTVDEWTQALHDEALERFLIDVVSKYQRDPSKVGRQPLMPCDINQIWRMAGLETDSK